MADGYKLWSVCPQCKGTGLGGDSGLENNNCVVCNGIKFVVGGYVDTSNVVTLPANLPTFPE